MLSWNNSLPHTHPPCVRVSTCNASKSWPKTCFCGKRGMAKLCNTFYQFAHLICVLGSGDYVWFLVIHPITGILLLSWYWVYKSSFGHGSCVYHCNLRNSDFLDVSPNPLLYHYFTYIIYLANIWYLGVPIFMHIAYSITSPVSPIEF